MITFKCAVCDKECKTYRDNPQYCSRTCYDKGRVKKRSLVPPTVTVFSGETRLINGRIKVNSEYYDWLSQFAWQVLGKGYVTTAVTDNGRETTIRIHRLVMNAQPGQMIDHINRDKLDNTIQNLRFINNSDNVRNTLRYETAKNYYYSSGSKKWIVKLHGKNQAYCKTEQEAIDYVEKYIRPLKRQGALL